MNMLDHSRRIWTLSLGLLLLLGACKPKAGAPCNGSGLPMCSDPAAALICTNGVTTAVTCHGAKGCTSSATAVDCDNSIAAVGDGCAEAGDVACAADRKSALECQNGKFALAEPCKGTRGCTVENNAIHCDNDVSDVGDACRVDADYACTTDKLMVLKCINKKFTELNACRGKNACRVMELPEEKKTEFVCDDSLAQENDSCDTENEPACSMDKTEVLECKSGHFAKVKPCPGGCSFDEKGERFECSDATAAAAGAATTPASTTKTVAKPAAPAAKAAAAKPAPAVKAIAAKPAAAKPAAKKK